LAKEFKIMLVEDSDTQALMIQDLLETQGWQVSRFATGEAALEALGKESFDLIVLDFYLPGIHGDEVCRRVRMNFHTRGMPVVMLTLSEEQQLELEGINSGADAYISKPVDQAVFTLRISAILNKLDQKGAAKPLPFDLSSLRKARILAIDDSPTYLEYLVTVLTDEGYTVESCTNGADAIKRIEVEHFDCILVDLIMPELDGIEVCNRINKIQSVIENPLVLLMLTAHENKEEMTKGLAAGADDFVGKASDLAILKARIRALLRRKFLQEENRNILEELKNKELEALKARARQEIAEAKAELFAELEKTAVDLKRSNEELSAAREDAQRANSAKSEFLAQMSHEIRTPINGVIGMTGLLRDTKLDPQQREYVEQVRWSADSLLQVINDILDFSKIEAGKLELEILDFDLEKLMVNTEKSLRFAAKLRENEITTKIAPGAATCLKGDPGRLRQVFTNLISNAVKFTHKGSVEISAKPEKNENGEILLRFEVKDTGIGIPPAALKRLFQAFTQVDASTTRKYGGTGLGLSICKRLVGLMGGEIGVISEEGKGSTFWFTAKFTAGSEEVLRQEASAANASIPVTQGARILLAEDNVINQKIAIAVLEGLGYRCEAVANGKEVLEALSTIPYDLVLMDCQMPEMDGYQATEILRQNEKPDVRDLPVVAMTANAMSGDREKCIAAGMDDYVSKPIDKMALKAVIEKWLPKNANRKQA
jgi:two-component system sensor histidine kinase/response regulator